MVSGFRLTSLSLCLAVMALAGHADDSVTGYIDDDREATIALAEDIWQYAEMGYLETQSTERLQEYLQRQGFDVQSGLAGMPTAFLASYGKGEPIIGILAEFDALPGLSQLAKPAREARIAGAPGHACGHHLFGAASAAAGAAIAAWLEESDTEGTVRVYGTPAEEGGSGKVYMTREGLFDDVDVVLHWHPADRNHASPSSTTSNKSGRFSFHGVAAHAASAPDRGRSALDGVEVMNYMVNMMREHVPSDSRMHYVITDGGDAPNIVPEFAQVYYYVRHPRTEMVEELFERVVNAARAAAMGTETRLEYEVMHGNYPILPNETLSALVDGNMRKLGGLSYSPAEQAFAETIYKTLIKPTLPLGSENQVQPFVFRQGMGSTDVGDVSWTVPTVGFGTATWVPGTPAHSWQAVAAGGTTIGHKGMILAAKTLAVTATDLYENPALIERAREEFEERRGANFEYSALLGDRKPPLDYRL